MNNKSVFPRLRVFVFVGALFLISLAFLITTPQVVKLAESKIDATNETPQSPKYIEDVTKSITKKIQERIIEKNLPPPLFSSNAVLALDYDSGKILYEKNINSRLSPASTTKIMTALVASDHYKPDDILIVTKEATVGGSTMGLAVGEKLTFRSLLYGMLLNSGNDAAFTIALNYPGGMNGFMIKMNERVNSMGLKNTHFQNPAGFDGPDHYSSAFDLAKIAFEAVKNPQLARIVATKATAVTSVDNVKSHALKNLNQLLGEEGVLGVKTGFTEKAGENLVGLVERNGSKVLTVVLSSQNRFGETKSLINWVYTNFTWQ